MSRIIDDAFDRARDVLRLNVTERGFTACSPAHDTDPHSNYRSVWARDSAMTVLWSLPLKDAELAECARRSLETILSAQSPDGHLPNYVEVETGRPEFGGTGNISGIGRYFGLVKNYMEEGIFKNPVFYVRYISNHDYNSNTSRSLR